MTEACSRKLVQPKRLRCVARLIGLMRSDAHFEVQGTLREAWLGLSLTDSGLWKLAFAMKISEPVRQLPQGKAPLWSLDRPPLPFSKWNRRPIHR